MFKRLIISAVVVLPLVFALGCQKGGGTRSGSVMIEPVKVQESSPVITVPGVLIARDRAEVKTPYATRIAEVFVNKGDRVTEGTPLARLSEEEINLKLSQLRAAKREAEASLEKNTTLLKGRDRLLEEGKIDKTQFDGIAIEASGAEASLERIRADLAVQEYNLNHVQILSPIRGIISEKYASPAQTTGENQILFVIVSIDPILASFQLSTGEAVGIKIGLPVNVKIDELDGEEFKGTISYIGPEINQQGRTFDVWAAIPNPDYTLKVGMFASAEVTSTNIHKVFAVPASSVITRDREKYVFTVAGGLAKRTKVNVRNIRNNVAEISSGLMENDFVVVQGAGDLYDGAAVDTWRR